MKKIVLSDHTGDMIAMQERQHYQQYDIEMARYRRESTDLTRRVEEEHESRMSEYQRELVAWNALSWVRKFVHGISKWRVLFLLCVAAMVACVVTYIVMPGNRMILLGIPVTAGFMALFLPTRAPRQPSRERVSMRWLEPPRPPRGESSDEERMWQAGNEGERRVTAHLSSLLNDDWTLLSGYIEVRAARSTRFLSGRAECVRWRRSTSTAPCLSAGTPGSSTSTTTTAISWSPVGPSRTVEVALPVPR